MRIFIVLLFCGLLFCACERDKSPFKPEAGGAYPLQVGNQWVYQRLFAIFNFRPLEEGMTFPSDTVRAMVTVRIVKEVVLQDSIKTTQLLDEYVDSNMSLTDESYYANRQGGLYKIAYRMTAGGFFYFPKKTAGAGILFNGQRFHNLSEITRLLTHVVTEPALDSLIYETPPRLCLKYPLTLNSQWTYLKSGLIRIDKKIVAQEEVSVPAGTFTCYKIQWMYDLNTDGVWDENIIFYDYVCEKGLIKRSIFFKDVQAVGVDLAPLGTFDAIDEGQLSKVVLK